MENKNKINLGKGIDKASKIGYNILARTDANGSPCEYKWRSTQEAEEAPLLRV